MKEAVRGLLVTALLIGPAVSQAAAVTVGSREWRQLTDTTGFSWDSVATVCDSTNGVCTGSLVGSAGEVSFTDWTWAAAEDVQGLFNGLIGDFFPAADSDYTPGTTNSPEIQGFFAPSNFEPTSADTIQRFAIGVSRTRDFFGSTLVRAPTVEDRLAPTCTTSFDCDQARLFVFVTETAIDRRLGVWLYRELTPVPEPGTLVLLGIGLAGLLGVSRRRSGGSDIVQRFGTTRVQRSVRVT